jgi:hypothetical protein
MKRESMSSNPCTKALQRTIATILIVSTVSLGIPLTAQASMVSSTASLTEAASTANRDKVQAFLARADVAQGLQERGLSAVDASARVNAMTDREVADLAGRIDQAPAGGEILGVLFTVFIVLLVTDILGLTKVFPFTRSVR